ncbi:uncharacterized protein [Narcine bancroftii]|uniref:uncharacterized protein n=1 Tax=Narcine bancroftii TaxID=1343680 RepID=UPI003831578C
MIGQVRNGQEPCLPVGSPVQVPLTLNPGPIRKGPLQLRVEGSPQVVLPIPRYVQNSQPHQSQGKQTPLLSLPQQQFPQYHGVSPLQMSQSQRLSQQPQAPRLLLQQTQAPQRLYQQLPVPQGQPLIHLRDQRLWLSHVLRPDRLELNPRKPRAGMHFGRWQRCFLKYVEGAEASDKELLMLLLAQLGDHPYSLIQYARSSQEAMSILQRHYSKGHRELHSRYRVMTRSQQVGESARDFILSLKDLARGCNFKAVSAQEYTEDLIRDRIVAGIRSTETRHRLLEKGMVGLEEAETIAEALESTRKELEEYSQDPGTGTNVILLDSLAPQKEKYVASQEFTTAAAP